MRTGKLVLLGIALALQFCGVATNQTAQAASKSSTMVELEPGVYFYETSYCDANGGVPTRLWVYLPKYRTGNIPCVVVAPAGSRLFHGNDLGDDSRPEHLPYVRKGMAVVAYAIDGPLADEPTQAQMVEAAAQFKNADGGILNAKSAIGYASRLKGIDSSRIVIAGHSSAATLALQVAEHNPKVKACIAYAPVADVVKRIGPSLLGFKNTIPGFSAFIADISPITHVDDLTCPTFIFHAADDENVTGDSLEPFVTKLKNSNDSVKYMEVPTGGHYESMVDQGIPAALEWLDRQHLVAAAELAKPTTPNPAGVKSAGVKPAAAKSATQKTPAKK